MNLLYLFKREVIRLSSKNSVESLAICKIISDPRSVLSEALSLYSGLPSQLQ